METVYVIGAGASKEAGLPIGEELKIDIEENRANALDDMLYLERNYDALTYIEDAEDRAKAQNPQDNL